MLSRTELVLEQIELTENYFVKSNETVINKNMRIKIYGG